MHRACNAGWPIYQVASKAKNCIQMVQGTVLRTVWSKGANSAIPNPGDGRGLRQWYPAVFEIPRWSRSLFFNASCANWRLRAAECGRTGAHRWTRWPYRFQWGHGEPNVFFFAYEEGFFFFHECLVFPMVSITLFCAFHALIARYAMSSGMAHYALKCNETNYACLPACLRDTRQAVVFKAAQDGIRLVLNACARTLKASWNQLRPKCLYISHCHSHSQTFVRLWFVSLENSHVYLSIRVCMCVHTYIHTYIHTFMHTYIYMKNVDNVGLMSSSPLVRLLYFLSLGSLLLWSSACTSVPDVDSCFKHSLLWFFVLVDEISKVHHIF